ncbi:HdeD family acid-resistance protein [Devosia sp.]|uniref:HdeD family acid-resistance protein n=1 Tax=Devosia sp. TaxID=1871048 RepID=UPI003A949430
MAVSAGMKQRLALITGLRGLLMLLFGVFAVIWPTEALMVLVVAGALVLLAAGVLGLWGLTFGGEKSPNYWFDVVRNALAIIVGVLILISPLFSTVLTVTFLSVLIGIEALVFGAMEIFLVVRERESYARIWPMVVQGVFYILFGLVLVIFPMFSAMIGAIWIGIIAVIFGVGLMTVAWRMYRAA